MPQWVIWLFMEKLAPFLNVERPGVEEEEPVKGNITLIKITPETVP